MNNIISDGIFFVFFVVRIVRAPIFNMGPIKRFAHNFPRHWKHKERVHYCISSC